MSKYIGLNVSVEIYVFHGSVNVFKFLTLIYKKQNKTLVWNQFELRYSANDTQDFNFRSKSDNQKLQYEFESLGSSFKNFKL